jgi:hypothetical protein
VAPVWLEQAPEAGVRPQLGDVELDGVDPGVPFPLSVSVAMGQPGLSPFVQSSANQLC